MQEIIQFITKHTMLSMLWFFLFSMVMFLTFHSLYSKVSEITSTELIRLFNKEDALIIDLRNPDDYRKGHITHSINLTETNIKNGNFGKIEKYKHKPVIVVYNNDIISRYSAKKLKEAGFERVYILKEGISGWIREHLPIVQ